MKKRMLVLIVLLIGLLAACSDNDDDTTEEKSDTDTPVETVKVEKGDLETEKTLYGRTAPKSSTPIMVQTPGEVDSLKVANGDKVDEDDVVATLAGGQDLKAPKDGVIVQLSAEEGSVVSDSDPFALVADLDTLKIKLNVTADELDLLKKDDKYQAVVGEEEEKAKITSIDKMPDDTGLFPVEATIDNDDENMLPGEVAKLTVPEQKIKDALIVPTEAIIEENGKSFVFVLNDDTVTKTEVTVKETQSDESAIKGDVKKDDEVVTNGHHSLEDDSKVNVQKEGNPS